MTGILARPVRPAGDPPVWEPVSGGRPCPVCGGAEGCAVVEAEALVRCRSRVSPRPVAGGGWLHAAQSADGYRAVTV